MVGVRKNNDDNNGDDALLREATGNVSNVTEVTFGALQTTLPFATGARFFFLLQRGVMICRIQRDAAATPFIATKITRFAPDSSSL